MADSNQIDAEIAELQRQIAESQEKLAQQIVESPTITQGWVGSHSTMLTLTGFTLLFGVMISVIVAYLIRTGSEPEAVLRVFGTVTIIFAAVFLIVAGFSDSQIAPVIGLLGTIVGYLLGRAGTSKQAQEP